MGHAPKKSRRPRRRKTARSSQGLPSHPPEPGRSFSQIERPWKYFWGCILGVLTLFGIWYGFRPILAVDVFEYMNDPSGPFSALFQISNNGNSEVYDPISRCRIRTMRTEQGETVTKERVSTELFNRRPVLPPHESFTVRCRIGLGGVTATYADIDIVVSFRPSWFYRLTHGHECHRFVTKDTSDGRLRWSKEVRPASEICPKYSPLRTRQGTQ
jgi:hypothetical protein